MEGEWLVAAMIEIQYNGGRFGNHLMQLSCAAAIANKFKQNISNPFGQNIIQIPKFEDTKYDKTLVINDSNIVELFLLDKIDFNISLQGFLQLEQCVQKFIKYNKFVSTDMIDATFVHLRLDDLIKLGFSLPFEYYDNALSSMSHNRIILSTDSPDHDIVKKLQEKYAIDMYFGDETATIILGASCKQKILSQGTFSWWIGFINNDKTEKTIYPDVNKYRMFCGDIFSGRGWASF